MSKSLWTYLIETFKSLLNVDQEWMSNFDPYLWVVPLGQ